MLPFHDGVVEVRLSPRDTVLTNANRLVSVGGGGTNCSAALARLNARGARGDLVVFVSDLQSWMDAEHGRSTATLREWGTYRNPAARLVCIDVQPYGTTQAAERADVLNVGGFSDQAFEVMAEFAAGRLAADHWVGLIERVTL